MAEGECPRGGEHSLGPGREEQRYGYTWIIRTCSKCGTEVSVIRQG